MCSCIRKDMSANRKEIDQAMEEGVQIVFLTVPHRVVSHKKGMVIHLEYIRMNPNNGGKGNVIHAPKLDLEKSQTLVSQNCEIQITMTEFSLSPYGVGIDLSASLSFSQIFLSSR